MNEIGGYFELELAKGEEYHKNAIRLNTGRNAFEYILRAKKYKKVFLPYYTCDVMLEPIKKLKLDFEFYNIDQSFYPVFDFGVINNDSAFVYTNYFGICDSLVTKVVSQCQNLILDNSQAFFSKPLPGIDTFYSPRKFFGLPDGAYLYTDNLIEAEFEQDNSEQRFIHLIGRIEKGPEAFYTAFKNNDAGLDNQTIKHMSKITQLLLKSIDYEQVMASRKQNFDYLHQKLVSSNKLQILKEEVDVPLVYPYWADKEGLWDHLLDNKIYVARYWPNVLEWCKSSELEYKLTKEIIHLPIDQRYSQQEMDEIINKIKN